MGREPEFGVNNFGKAKLQTETESMGKTLFMILMNKPGFMPSIPLCGMDVHSMLYSFYDEIDTNALLIEIGKQCPALSTYIANNTLQCKKMIINERPALVFVMLYTIEGVSNRLIFTFRSTPEGEVVYDYHFNDNDDSESYRKQKGIG